MKSTAFAAAAALALPLLATTSIAALAANTDEFVNKVAISDMFEVKTGKLATEKAKDEDVKDFGEEMVDDHTATSEDLKQLVESEKIDVKMPSNMDDRHKDQLEKLKQLSGAEFDRAYVPTQVLAHEQAVNLFEDYSKSGDNDALKKWASDTLPTLKEHLKEARELNQELSAPAKTAAAEPNDKAADDMKATDTKAMEDKGSMDKVTNETDVDGTDKTAMNDKAADKDKDHDKTAENKEAAAPSFEYVTSQSPTDWTAQTLIGKTVQNEEDETLGEINNVILNEKGQVVAVTIGVGGFLGLGEKDVGVPFEALKFETPAEAVENSETASQATNEEKEKADEASRMDADHSNIKIVIDATKEQLESAPDFVWLGEKRERRADADNENESVVE